MASTSSLRRPCRKLLGSGAVCKCRGWDPLSADDLFCDSCECHVSFHEPYLPTQSGLGRCLKPIHKLAGSLDGCQVFYQSNDNPKKCDGCGCHANIHEEVTEPSSKRLKLQDVQDGQAVETDDGSNFGRVEPHVQSNSVIARDHALEPKHKVFLSHSGAQKDFVEQLFYDLKRCDQTPFFDKCRCSLEIGFNIPEVIFEAIKHCHVGILILSEDFFTRSKWPMLELVAMVKENESREGNKIRIMPVFYCISQDECCDRENHVRWISQWKSWAYKDKRISIEEWEKALEIFEPTTGLVFNIKSGEVKFREEIVNAVCRISLPKTRWDDSEVQGRTRLCEALIKRIEQVTPSYGVQVVGLYGIGGIGKTTICKTLCNYLSTKFCDKVCHIELRIFQDDKEVLQEVLKKLTDLKHDVLDKSNIEECRGYFKKEMFNHKVFLAIDNISDDLIEQAKTYLRAHYKEGSIIIFTARSIDVLSKCLKIKESDCLEMPEMDEIEAKSLFFKHAKNSLSKNFEINKQYVNACLQKCLFSKGFNRGFQYHPLALKILGNSGYDPQRYSKQLNDSDIFNPYRTHKHPIFSILRTSYDSLLYKDQLLFMDVAIFVPDRIFGIKTYWNFIEWLCMIHKSSIQEMIEQLENLKRKSLLESFDDVSGTIYIHDLWIEFCKAETKLKDPRAIRLEEDQCTDLGESWKDLKRICFIRDGWINVKRLPRFSNVTVLQLVGEYDWWQKEPIVLDLRGMECLKSFELHSGSSFTYDNSNKDYGLGSLTNLEYLHWSFMAASRESIEKIGCLTKLQVLILINFQGENFPDISNLTSLRVVDFCFGEKVQTITGLNSGLTNLQLLDLSYCKALRSCPGVGDLVALKELDLSFCKKLKKLPSYLGKLSNLRKLDLDGCKSLRSISGLSDLVSLEELTADNCTSLNELPDLLTLTMLRNLQMYSTTPVSKVPGFQGLISLEILHAHFEFLEEWPDLGKLPLLREVYIDGWSGPGLSSTANLELLEDLTVVSCEEVDVLPDLQNLKRLRSLSLQFSNFKDLATLCNLTSLHVLEILDCPMLETLPDMHMLTNMRTLYVSSCDNLNRLPDAHFPTTLRTLRIKKCKNWEMMLNTSSHTKPGSLTYWRDNVWRNCWPGVSNLTLLESLEVEGFARMKNFPNVNRLTCLRSLTLTSGGYKTVHGIEHLCQLEILKCCDLFGIVEIPDLGNFPRLKELKLHNCAALKSVTSREPLAALEKINLSYCFSLKDMPDLSSFPRLEGLSLLYCEELMKLTSREQLHSLKRVRLQGCESLDVVPDYLSSCIQNNMVLNSFGLWEDDVHYLDFRDYWSESSMSESSDMDDSDGTSDASNGTLDAFDTISDA